MITACDRISGKEVVIKDEAELLHSRFLINEMDEFLIADQTGLIKNSNATISLKQKLSESSETILEIIFNDIMDCNTLALLGKVSPLYRNVKDYIILNKKQHFLIDQYINLDVICNKPDIDVAKSEERVNLSRVKRINYRTISFLATHAEDWEYRKNDIVFPKRLYAEEFVTNYEIYENLVVKTLLNRLLNYWNQVLADKDIIEENNDKMEKLKNVDPNLNNHNAKRIYSLWNIPSREEKGRTEGDY